MTAGAKAILTRWDRKERLGHGAVKEIAAAFDVDAALVSRVVNGRQRHARIELFIAGRIGRPGEMVFPPRETRATAAA